MATKQNRHLPAPTNFDVWRDSLTPEAIADGKFVTFSCGGCPAYGESCNRYDARCRANFVAWAKAKSETGAPIEEPEAVQEQPEGGAS